MVHGNFGSWSYTVHGSRLMVYLGFMTTYGSRFMVHGEWLNESNGLMVQMERRAPSKHLFDAFQRARREFESPLVLKKEE